MEKNRTFLDARSSVFSLNLESCVWWQFSDFKTVKSRPVGEFSI